MSYTFGITKGFEHVWPKLRSPELFGSLTLMVY
jgi:hypothetical protein